MLEFKNKADSIELCAMDKAMFDNNVAMAIQQTNEIHIEHQSTYSDLGNNYIAISLKMQASYVECLTYQMKFARLFLLQKIRACLTSLLTKS